MRTWQVSPDMIRNRASFGLMLLSESLDSKSSSLKEQASDLTARTQCAMDRSMRGVRSSFGSWSPFNPQGPQLVEIQCVSYCKNAQQKREWASIAICKIQSHFRT